MAALEIVSLDTTTPQLRAPSAADTYTAPRAMDITPVALTGSSATSSLSIAQTWNTTGTPTAFDLNVTDTASNASSLLMNLRVGGTSRTTISKAGVIRSGSGGGLEIVQNGAAFSGNRSGVFTDTGSGASLFLSGSVRFSAAGVDVGGGADLILARDAANTLAQRNGVNAQAFNIYNTYTDASNYERGFIRWSSNTLQIGVEAAGTGTNRSISLQRISNIANVQSRFYFDGDNFVAANFNNRISIAAAGGAAAGAGDIHFVREGSGLLSLRGGANATAGAALNFIEQTAPAAPATDQVRIYAEDNGSGKTRLMALFATGAAQQIAIEP